jgi:hypothetical protein
VVAYYKDKRLTVKVLSQYISKEREEDQIRITGLRSEFRNNLLTRNKDY